MWWLRLTGVGREQKFEGVAATDGLGREASACGNLGQRLKWAKRTHRQRFAYHTQPRGSSNKPHAASKVMAMTINH